jgi:hypothetical protein
VKVLLPPAPPPPPPGKLVSLRLSANAVHGRASALKMVVEVVLGGGTSCADGGRERDGEVKETEGSMLATPRITEA